MKICKALLTAAFLLPHAIQAEEKPNVIIIYGDVMMAMMTAPPSKDPKKNLTAVTMALVLTEVENIKSMRVVHVYPSSYAGQPRSSLVCLQRW